VTTVTMHMGYVMDTFLDAFLKPFLNTKVYALAAPEERMDAHTWKRVCIRHVSLFIPRGLHVGCREYRERTESRPRLQ
jgi:hypothetical protein